MQVKLLRVIQEREVLRLGGTHAIKTDVRFIAATNRNIRDAVQKGVFRQDLYFRLNVINLHIPPLAQRSSDIPLLAHYFLQKHAALMRKTVSDITAEALDLLSHYDFPGNVRELENIIERSVALATSDTIGLAQLSDDLREAGLRTFRKKDGQIPTLQEMENDYIRWVLQESSGNQTLAAQMMGIDRVSLWRRLKKLQG
jgi:transcriptional regulator with PAS, ATPase and Fis domain